MTPRVLGSAGAVSGIGIAAGVFVWARTCRAGRWLHAYIRSFTEIGAHGRTLCVPAPALLQMATSTGTSLKPSATTDVEVLPSGCSHDLAQAVVR